MIIYETFIAQYLISFFLFILPNVCLIAIFKTEALWRKLLTKKMFHTEDICIMILCNIFISENRVLRVSKIF